MLKIQEINLSNAGLDESFSGNGFNIGPISAATMQVQPIQHWFWIFKFIIYKEPYVFQIPEERSSGHFQERWPLPPPSDEEWKKKIESVFILTAEITIHAFRTLKCTNSNGFQPVLDFAIS